MKESAIKSTISNAYSVYKVDNTERYIPLDINNAECYIQLGNVEFIGTEFGLIANYAKNRGTHIDRASITYFEPFPVIHICYTFSAHDDVCGYIYIAVGDVQGKCDFFRAGVKDKYFCFETEDISWKKIDCDSLEVFNMCAVDDKIFVTSKDGFVKIVEVK